MRRILARIMACSLLVFAACATAGESPDGGDGDSSINLPPDADPNAPDADPNAPDANPAGTIDANTGTCPKSPCALVEQCGCTSPQVCDLDSAQFPSGGTECRDVLTPGTEDDTCASVFDCAAGYVCVGDSCRKYCNEDTDCSGPGGICLVQLQYGGGNDIPGAVVCTVDCQPNLVTGNSCPAGYGCHLYYYDPDGVADNGDEVNITDCDPPPASGGALNASCTTNDQCNPGLDCITVNGTPQCKYTCTLPGGTCPSGTCQGFTDPAIVGGVEYGVCI